MVLLASVGLAAALLAMIAHAQPHQYPVCSVIDGSAESSNSPCACGTSTCSWYETMCTSASNLCQATCGRYSCPPDSVQQGRFTQKRNGVDLETNPDDSKCCQESCLLLTSATCQSRLDCAWMGSSCSTAVCNHDDSARRRADVSCAHFKSYDKCALASSSRRRTYGGEARDTCQTTCATSIGCQVPTPAPTPLPLGATYSPTMAICAADSTSLCSYRANVPSNRRRQCMHSASFTADCQTSCSAEAGCKVATQGVDCLRIVAANAIGQTFCLDAIEFWNRESCDGIKVSVSGTPFASGSWSGSAPSMAFDSDFSSGPWCSNDGPHASSAPYIGMAWSSPVFIGCVRIKGGQGHTAIKLQTCTGGGGTAGSFSVSADVTGVSGWHAITIPFEDPKAPTESPTSFPSESPTTEAPTTSSPTEPPTDAPTTSSPTEAPTTSSPTEASSTLCGDWPSNSTYGCKHGDVYQRLSDYTSHAACQNLCGQQVATVGNLCCYVKIGSGCYMCVKAPPCSVTDGTATSSSYPCTCGTATCGTDQPCISSSSQCKAPNANCGSYTCTTEGWVKISGGESLSPPYESKCCQQEAALGDLNSNVCRDGYTFITDASTCQSKAIGYGFTWGGTYSRASLPKGCFVDTGGNAGFNTDVSGVEFPNFRPICQEASPPLLSTPMYVMMLVGVAVVAVIAGVGVLFVKFGRGSAGTRPHQDPEHELSRIS